jgi:riboflavin biosynthesis pyrimidine reductase
MALDASSYQMIQNYRTHHDALMEMSRLVTQDIANVHEKLNHLKK